MFLALGYSRVRDLVPRVSGGLKGIDSSWVFFVAHAVAFATFLAVCPLVLPPGPRNPFLVVLLYGSAVSSIVLAALAFVPWPSVVVLLRRTGDVWVYALIAAMVTGGAALGLVSYWNGSASNALVELTFRSVRACLGLFVPHVSVDLAAWRIGTSRFRVQIGGGCSGVEGLALMLVFTAAWLWFFRREHRFPQALLLVPAALATIWVANVARITALILIGDAGARAVASGGFHSQAGWIFFNGIALGFAVVGGRLPWLARMPEGAKGEGAAENATAAYLVPFLAILGATLVSRAASAGFEWLYPLRFVVALGALWFFRSAYASLDWGFGWPAVGAGCAVFGLWIGMDSWSGTPGGSTLETGLAALPTPARYGWLAARVGAAVLTVPLAEELAFRGYMARRVASSEFEAVTFRGLNLVSIAVSSVAFGALHGRHWIAGTLAGVLYALTLRHRGRIGDAVVAHATTNALLAAWVLTRGAWHLW